MCSDAPFDRVQREAEGWFGTLVVLVEGSHASLGKHSEAVDRPSWLSISLFRRMLSNRWSS